MHATNVQLEYTTDDLIKEALWETEILRKGRDEYLKTLENTNLTDTDIGMSLTSKMIPTVVTAIENLQAKLTDDLLAGSSRAKTGAAHLIPLCDPRNLAVAVVQHYLRAMLGSESEVSLRVLLDRMEVAYIEAMSLQLWEHDDEVEYTLFWKRHGDKLNGSSDSQTNRIKKRLKERLSSYYADFKEQADNTQAMQLSVATALLSCVGYTRVRMTTEDKAMDIAEREGMDAIKLVDLQFCYVEEAVGPFADMFILRTGTHKRKEVRSMHLSETACDALDYSAERGSIGNVALRPTLIKPKRWILTTS